MVPVGALLKALILIPRAREIWQSTLSRRGWQEQIHALKGPCWLLWSRRILQTASNKYIQATKEHYKGKRCTFGSFWIIKKDILHFYHFHIFHTCNLYICVFLLISFQVSSLWIFLNLSSFLHDLQKNLAPGLKIW